MRTRTQSTAVRPICLLLLALTALAFVAGAPEAEAQSPVSRADSAAVLLEAARDFEADGEYETADALLVYITERFGGTPAGEAAFALLSGPVGDRLEPISRVEIPVFSTTYGLWLGVAVPAMFGADNSEAYGAGLLVGGPLGLFSGLAYSRSRRFSAGQARAISFGGAYGSWLGYGWTQLLDLGIAERCDSFGCFPIEDEFEELMAGAVIGGLGGIAAGAWLAQKPIRSGVASGAEGGAIWGTIYGAMLAGIVDEDSGDGALVAALLGGKAGLIAGAALASKHDVTRPRVRLINLGALVGGLGGIGIDLLIEPDATETAIAIPLVTSVAGLIIAAASTRDRPAAADPGAGQGQGGALLGWRDGGLAFQTPTPMPTLLPMDDVNGRPTVTPGVTLELFRASFR